MDRLKLTRAFFFRYAAITLLSAHRHKKSRSRILLGRATNQRAGEQHPGRFERCIVERDASVVCGLLNDAAMCVALFILFGCPSLCPSVAAERSR